MQITVQRCCLLAKVLIAAGLLIAFCQMRITTTTASSIPIWEFLTRNEKMSYLYSTFAQLVSVHCKAPVSSMVASIPVNQCKRDLLRYGYERLQTFTDAQLDVFDPYQRDSNDLIWSTIMSNHPNWRKPANSETNLLGAASMTTTTQLTLPTVYNHQIQATGNPIFETANESKHQYAMDMDVLYNYTNPTGNFPLDDMETDTTALAQSELHRSYLTGPLVVRVKPDGSPVEEDQQKTLPRDDDLEAFAVFAAPVTTATSNNYPHKRSSNNPAKNTSTSPAIQQQQLSHS